MRGKRMANISTTQAREKRTTNPWGKLSNCMAKHVADDLKDVEEQIKKVEEEQTCKTPVLPQGSVGDLAARVAVAPQEESSDDEEFRLKFDFCKHAKRWVQSEGRYQKEGLNSSERIVSFERTEDKP